MSERTTTPRLHLDVHLAQPVRITPRPQDLPPIGTLQQILERASRLSGYAVREIVFYGRDRTGYIAFPPSAPVDRAYDIEMSLNYAVRFGVRLIVVRRWERLTDSRVALESNLITEITDAVRIDSDGCDMLVIDGEIIALWIGDRLVQRGW